MYQVPKAKARRWQQVSIQKYIYLINVGLYSLASYLSIFENSTIIA